MDFSKIKKIFYIVAIISMLLSIKSKVFASTYDFTYEDTNFNLNIPDWIIENDLNYSFTIYNNSSTHQFYLLVYSADSVNINDVAYDKDFIYFSSDNICLFSLGQSGNTFAEFMNNTNDYINNDVTFENYNKRKSNKTTNILKTFFYDSFIKETTAPIKKNNEIVLDTTITHFSSPYFTNATEIEKGYPDGVFISRGDYSENDALYFHLLKITNTVPDGNQSTYYYDSKVFKLTKDSKYYYTYDADTDNKYSYYYINRSALTLDTNSSYLYVLSNSGNSISNSYGILQPDIPGGIYTVVESDTAGVITEQDALNDKISNINNNQQEYQQKQQEYQQKQQEFQNQNTILPETDTNISNSLQFDNSTPQFSNLFNDYFSQLTTLIADLGNYDNNSVTTINLPIPHTNTNIPIRSDIIKSNLPSDIYFIIQMVWYFIFGKYFISFILKIYNLFVTGQILDHYSQTTEVITHDML